MHLPGRDDLTFANVVSVVALFVALGGTSYAVATGSIGSREIANNSVRGKDIRNRTITSRDVKRNGLGGTSIKESRLARVPRARDAARLGGTPLEGVLQRCPPGTRLVADACVETAVHPANAYGGAESVCRGAFRRLATFEEVDGVVAFTDIDLTPGGELTGTLVEPSDPPDVVRVLALVEEPSGAKVVPGTAAGAKPYRCALDPTNSSPGARPPVHR